MYIIKVPAINPLPLYRVFLHRLSLSRLLFPFTSRRIVKDHTSKFITRYIHYLPEDPRPARWAGTAKALKPPPTPISTPIPAPRGGCTWPAMLTDELTSPRASLNTEDAPVDPPSPEDGLARGGALAHFSRWWWCDLTAKRLTCTGIGTTILVPEPVCWPEAPLWRPEAPEGVMAAAAAAEPTPTPPPLSPAFTRFHLARRFWNQIFTCARIVSLILSYVHIRVFSRYIIALRSFARRRIIAEEAFKNSLQRCA